MDLINAAVLTGFNLVVLGLLVWFMGSIALRFVGWGWILFGLAIAVSGAATGSATAGTYALAAFNLALGLFFWSCGHVLYRARRGYWKSSVMHGITARVHLRRHAGRPDVPVRASGRLP